MNSSNTAKFAVTLECLSEFHGVRWVYNFFNVHKERNGTFFKAECIGPSSECRTMYKPLGTGWPAALRCATGRLWPYSPSHPVMLNLFCCTSRSSRTREQERGLCQHQRQLYSHSKLILKLWNAWEPCGWWDGSFVWLCKHTESKGTAVQCCTHIWGVEPGCACICRSVHIRDRLRLEKK